MKKTIYTIGHSTRSIEEFIQFLQVFEIQLLVDVRTIPKSRHNPQFNEGELKKELKKFHIQYKHLKTLGGLRHTTKDSVNQGWRNASFRGYADYMQSEEFHQGLEELEELAGKKKTAIMCAEAVPWRCHRSLIADALTVQKWTVLHIQSKKTARQHALTPFLKVDEDQLTYPGP